jgi:hypothetical protein
MCPTGTWSACKGSEQTDSASARARTRLRKAGTDTDHLLDLDLLERNELARPGLHRQATQHSILPTRVRRALHQGQERPTEDLLERLLSARFARVGVDEDVRLDIRDSRRDSSDGDEGPEVASLDVSDGERVLGGGSEGFDVEVAAEQGHQDPVSSDVRPRRRRMKGGRIYSLSSRQTGRELVRIVPPKLHVPLLPLLHDKLHHVVLLADVDCRRGHELIDDFRDDVDVPAGIAGYVHRERIGSVFELEGVGVIE